MLQHFDDTWAIIPTSRWENLKLRVVRKLKSDYNINQPESAIKLSYPSKYPLYHNSVFCNPAPPPPHIIPDYLSASGAETVSWVCQLSHRNSMNIITRLLLVEAVTNILLMLHFAYFDLLK